MELDHFRSALTAVDPTDYILATQLDPDALASALGLQHLILKVTGHKLPVVYSGAIGHPQNRALINACGLGALITKLSDFGNAVNEGRPLLVDSSTSRDVRLPVTMLPLIPRVVIDHHRGDFEDGGGEGDQYFWIDGTVGAASTLIIELAVALEVQLPDRLTVPLALGIYTDTKALTAASERDREAYGRVTNEANRDEVINLINYPLPESHYRNLEYALGHTELRHGVMLVGTGWLDPADGDDLSTIADYMLRKVGVTTVIVWGIINNAVRISARSTNIGDPLDEFLQGRFGSGGAKVAPDGRAEGGARMELGMDFWLSPGVRDEVEALVKARIKELVYGKA